MNKATILLPEVTAPIIEKFAKERDQLKNLFDARVEDFGVINAMEHYGERYAIADETYRRVYNISARAALNVDIPEDEQFTVGDILTLLKRNMMGELEGANSKESCYKIRAYLNVINALEGDD